MARRRPHRSSARDIGDDHRAGREHRPLDGTRRAGLCSSGLSPADRHLTEGVPCRLAWIVVVNAGDGDGSTLLCQRASLSVVEVGEEQGVQLACEVALGAAHDLLGAFALRGAPLGVGAGGGVDAQAGERDHPQRVVGLAVVAAVDSLGRLGCQVGLLARLTVMGGPSGWRRGRSPRVQLCAVTCLAP
jgi:hypothetical protein